MPSDVSERGAVGEPAQRAIHSHRAAVPGPAQLVNLCDASLVRLRGLEICIVRCQSKLLSQVPAELRLDARAAARLVTVGGAEEEGDRIEHVDDLVVQTLLVAGERRLQRSTAIAQRELEPARTLRLKRRIAAEVVGEKTVQIEEGRLRNSL